jgi:hypothetical protein
MSSAADFEEQQPMISALMPAVHHSLSSPPTISNSFFDELMHVVHDVGGQLDVPMVYEDIPERDWEMRTYVTCECLAWRGTWTAEERRRSENDLGATLYYGFPYYGRWITGAAKTLLNKGLITPDELNRKIDEVRERLGVKP